MCLRLPDLQELDIKAQKILKNELEKDEGENINRILYY